MQPRTNRVLELPPAALSVAFGCASLFLLPFLAAGIWIVISGLSDLHEYGWHRALPPLLAGGAFVGFPLLCAGGLVYAMRHLRQYAALRGAHPDAPWLWRPDWAAGYASDRMPNGAVFLLVFALVWNAISGGALFAAWRASTTRFRPEMLFVAIFPLVGLGLLIGALYLIQRRRKFGRTICRLQQLPIEPGCAFSGELETHVQEPPENGFVLALRCVERIQRGKSTQENTLWTEATTIPRGALAPSPAAMRIPFTLTFPADADAKASGRGVIHWALKATADVPGVDYAAEFELPVFRRESR